MNYLRVVLGKQHMFFGAALKAVISVSTLAWIDFSNDLPDNWRKFNKNIPEYLERHPVHPKLKRVLYGQFPLWQSF